jgi:hypothetical protein
LTVFKGETNLKKSKVVRIPNLRLFFHLLQLQTILPFFTEIKVAKHDATRQQKLKADLYSFRLRIKFNIPSGVSLRQLVYFIYHDLHLLGFCASWVLIL